ncbi:MAG: cytochrome c biogenesis heme-transporting ATPase CcmA [Pseudomonadota bacterium]
MEETFLNACDLSCVRDDQVLFSGLNFELTGGRVLLLEGRNGSGKTSLLRILCGIRAPESGSVKWHGTDIDDLGSDYHADLTYVGHLDGIKSELTVRENLRMAIALGKSNGICEDAALERVGLRGFEDTPTHVLSAGQRRRLALSRLLVRRSPLWLLDEPFTALDKNGIAVFEKLMSEHVGRGGLAVLTSHHDVNLEGIDCQRIDLSA